MPVEPQDDRVRLIAALADGNSHLWRDLEGALEWPADRVRATLAELPALGLRAVVDDAGIRLAWDLELLDAGRLAGLLAPATRDRLQHLAVLGITDSTSDRLRALPPPPPDEVLACLAEYQTGGRGRRGRSWLSPYGQGLCMSLRRRFTPAPARVAPLGLAVAVALHRAMTRAGVPGLGLKWPNDVVCADGKVAGLLADLGSEPGAADVTVGIGINVRVDPELRRQVLDSGGLAPVGIESLAGVRLSRNAVAAAVLDGVVAALETFARAGFVPFADEWRERDVLYGQEILVQAGPRTIRGIAQGIDADGALLVDVAGDLQSVVSGDVTVRTRT